ncbi:hypothetical protein SK128_026444 [Halocaridina rubra]|uniref:Uncharacterized protein n=1 Tax=Halocaridina rubra TaxID=373956 RepID=A0AAN8WU01_HALRR
MGIFPILILARYRSARLPPISADPRKRNEVQVAKSPEVADVPTRRSRIRTHVPGKLSKPRVDLICSFYNCQGLIGVSQSIIFNLS